MIPARVLIAGVGNIFFGDDAFGSEVARRLLRRTQADGVHVIDFGIRGLDLAYALQDGHQAAVLIDATARGGPPGTLYVLEPDGAPGQAPALDPHGLEPATVLLLAESLGGSCPRVLILGCEPESCEEGIGLSATVSAAVEKAVELAESLAAKLLKEEAERGSFARREEASPCERWRCSERTSATSSARPASTWARICASSCSAQIPDDLQRGTLDNGWL
jgi:hydrogenase maturation protease